MAMRTHKLHLLDGLRGLAALAVLSYHLSAPGFAHGYLAVDFFFMLSGFVVTLAYQQRLDEGLPLRDFLAVRVARLYPLYLLGLALGAIVALPHAVAGGGILRLLAASGVGAIFLPAPFAIAGSTDLFPFNLALWSLIFEVLANVGHALLLRRRSERWLQGTVAAAAVLLVWQAVAYGSLDLGSRFPTLAGGLVRVCFGYGMGVLLYRVWCRDVARLRVPAVAVAAVLLGVLAAPLLGWRYDACCVLVVFPVLLLGGAYAQVSGPWTRICAELGAVSYAVYVLHVPLIAIANALVRQSHVAVRLHTLQVVAGCFIVGAAYLADKVYDAPARAFLKGRLTQRKNTPAAQS